ncbi:unnamed protein product [Miscanthus lutarioriparius]|uniref:Uncharacterized protein n=1 Tax=Miscanthus lutarioriparius TaxID=422564 RepID=A0A811MRA7_9POAL|nr:unnamed protein product [Miscanthus lutarioriparius]
MTPECPTPRRPNDLAFPDPEQQQASNASRVHRNDSEIHQSPDHRRERTKLRRTYPEPEAGQRPDPPPAGCRACATINWIGLIGSGGCVLIAAKKKDRVHKACGARSTGGLNTISNDNSPATDSKDLRAKLVLLGDSGVGKSCIVLRFVRGQFDPTSKVTVGASFLSQTLALEDSTIVKFEIWDTAGQERYAALAPLYYRGAAAAIVVYDITSPESFSKAQYWVKELQKHGSPGIVMVLVGNKADLHDNRSVSLQDAQDYAEKNNMFFIETSAKTADNINQLFEVRFEYIKYLFYITCKRIRKSSCNC